MITVHIIIRSGALEGESSRSFSPGRNGLYRGVEAYLKKVKKMYNSAIGLKEGKGWRDYEVGSRDNPNFMHVTISSCESSPSLFPYTSEEINKLRTKYRVS